MHLARSYDLAESMTDGILVPAISLSTYKEAAVSYIAGFVCLMAKTKKTRLLCKTCRDALCISLGSAHRFVLLRDRGGRGWGFKKHHEASRRLQKKQNSIFIIIIIIIIIICPLTAKVVGAPQMTSRPVSSIFPCAPMSSGTWRTPGLSIFLMLSSRW